MDYTYAPVALSLKARDLKAGLNKLRFSSQRSGNTTQGWHTITELRFELPESVNVSEMAEGAPPDNRASQTKDAAAKSKLFAHPGRSPVFPRKEKSCG
jgi:hypothetical protein